MESKNTMNGNGRFNRRRSSFVPVVMGGPLCRDLVGEARRLSIQQKRHKSVDASIPEVTLLEDVYSKLGGYSWFQFWITVVMLLPEIPASMLSIAPVFTGTSNVRFICKNPTAQGGVDEFEEGDRIFLGTDKSLCSSNCSRIIPLNDQPHYESVVQEWNLICDRPWLTDTFTSIQMGGMMTGSFVLSILADQYGRKKCYYITNILMAVFGLASGLVTDVYSYGVVRFLSGFSAGGFYVVFNIYLIEFLTPSYRTIAGCVSIWCVGEMLLALIAYYVRSWRILNIASGVPAILLLITWPFVPESPRWLLTQNRTKEATRALRQVARWNFRDPVDQDTIEKLQRDVLAENQGDDDEEVGGGDRFPLLDVLRNPKLLVSLIIFVLGWFSCALVYYGITFNTKSLGGSPYLNVFILGLVDLPAFPSGALFSNCIGRKWTYSVCLMFASVFLVAIVILELTVGMAQYPTTMTVLCFLGRFGVAGAWGIVQCFTAEAFPTVVRSSCLGLCSIFSNVGGVVAPMLAYLATFSQALPFFVFCGFTVTSALLSWFLNETYGKPLENFVR